MKELRPLLISSYMFVAFISTTGAQQNIPAADARKDAPVSVIGADLQTDKTTVQISTDAAVLSINTINPDLQAYKATGQISPSEIITSLSNVSTADEKYSASSKWSLGFVYPGVAIKYKPTKESAWEVKAQSDSGVVAAGLRYYHYFNTTTNLFLFCGAEADYMRFKGEVSKGSGFAGGAFIGGETKLVGQLSLLMDFGPMYINLSDDEFSQSSSGVEYVLNMGVYWHFH